MDRKSLDHLFSAYIEKFDFMNTKPQEEYFKWTDIAAFQANFDIEAQNFAEMLLKVQGATKTLIDSNMQPLKGLCVYANVEPETVRKMFRDLFVDDGGDLTIRQKKIDAFIAAADVLHNKYTPGYYTYENNQRSVMAYLFCHDPDNHYLYKATEAQYLADRVGFYDDWGPMNAFHLDTFYRFCDQLQEEINTCPALLRTHERRFAELNVPYHADSNLHILLFDFIYCCHAYDLYTGFGFKPITSGEKAEYRTMRAKAQELLEKVYVAEQDVLMLADAKNAFNQLLQSGASIHHKTWGELEFLQEEHSTFNGKIFDFHCFRVKSNGKTQKVSLFSALANRQLSFGSPDFGQIMEMYSSVINREYNISDAYASAQKALEPYKKYL